MPIANEHLDSGRHCLIAGVSLGLASSLPRPQNHRMHIYTEPAPHGKPEQGQSPRFLKLLDPSASGFTFQTFDDDRARKNPAFTRIVQSPPPARDELVKLNKQGAGVFVTINETDGSGRKSENITRIRAVWQEDDDGFDGSLPAPSVDGR